MSILGYFKHIVVYLTKILARYTVNFVNNQIFYFFQLEYVDKFLHDALKLL
jgi:hypothetical protein